ncbi:MAG: O-methyltransferase [Paludibacteraceae bacterium]|nr:O-methyltransferase [Paludibacteraceae bacterium]
MSSPESEVLAAINRRTNVLLPTAHMLSGHVQGRVLSMLSRMIRPTHILELGTFVGYSALCLAEGLTPDGRLVTVEKNDELEEMIRENLSLSPLGAQIDLRIGTVQDVLRELRETMSETFDLVFLDADKRTYTEDLEALLPLVKQSGWILADNTLWDGHIIDPAYDRDKQTQGLRRFNEYVRNCPELENVILPIRDGITIIRKTR